MPKRGLLHSLTYPQTQLACSCSAHARPASAALPAHGFVLYLQMSFQTAGSRWADLLPLPMVLKFRMPGRLLLGGISSTRASDSCSLMPVHCLAGRQQLSRRSKQEEQHFLVTGCWLRLSHARTLIGLSLMPDLQSRQHVQIMGTS